jgi:hypothetical protein
MIQSFLTPQLAEFDDAFSETARSMGRSGLCRQPGPAGGFVWTRSAVPSWDGTAASNSLNHKVGLRQSYDLFLDSCSLLRGMYTQAFLATARTPEEINLLED